MEFELNEFESCLKNHHQKPVSIERRLKFWNIEYYFKWNQPYLSRVSNLSRGSNKEWEEFNYVGLYIYITQTYSLAQADKQL